MQSLCWGCALPHRGRGHASGRAGPQEGLGARGARLILSSLLGRFSTPPEGLLPPPGFVLAVVLRGFAHRRQAFLPSQRPLGRAMTRSSRPGPRSSGSVSPVL